MEHRCESMPEDEDMFYDNMFGWGWQVHNRYVPQESGIRNFYYCPYCGKKLKN
jgi:hypothetical protein